MNIIAEGLKTEEIEIGYLKTLLSDDDFNTKRMYLYWPRYSLEGTGERRIRMTENFTVADFQDAFHNLMLKFNQHLLETKQ